jgi:hypothetical protein
MTQYLGLNISDEIADALTQRIETTKETKTGIVTIALEKELGLRKDPSLLDRVENIENEINKIKLWIETNLGTPIS